MKLNRNDANCNLIGFQMINNRKSIQINHKLTQYTKFAYNPETFFRKCNTTKMSLDRQKYAVPWCPLNDF